MTLAPGSVTSAQPGDSVNPGATSEEHSLISQSLRRLPPLPSNITHTAPVTHSDVYTAYIEREAPAAPVTASHFLPSPLPLLSALSPPVGNALEPDFPPPSMTLCPPSPSLLQLPSGPLPPVSTAPTSSPPSLDLTTDPVSQVPDCLVTSIPQGLSPPSPTSLQTGREELRVCSCPLFRRCDILAN